MRTLGTVLAAPLLVVLCFALYVNFTSSQPTEYKALLSTTTAVPEDDTSWVIYNFTPCAEYQSGFRVSAETNRCMLFNSEGKRQGIFSPDMPHQEKYWFCGRDIAFVTCFDGNLKQILPEKTVGLCPFVGLVPKCPNIDPNAKVEQVIDAPGVVIEPKDASTTETKGYFDH